MNAPVDPVEPPTGDAALYQLKRFAEAADKIRANASTAAKTLGGLGSAGIAAVGVAKFSDVFPLPGDGWSFVGAVGLALLVVSGFALMGAAVLQLTGRIWQVGEPVFTTTNPDRMATTLTADELKLVRKVYKETIESNKDGVVKTLKDYEDKAIRLESQADAKTVPAAKRRALRAQATAIRNDIRATEARATALVVRSRAAAIGTAAKLTVPAILFAVGLAASSLSADGLDAWRVSEQDTTTDKEVATVKACADAAEALTKNNVSMDKLPPDCGKPEQSAAKTSSPAVYRPETLISLTNLYAQCVTANPDQQDSCALILTIISKATE